MQRSCRALLQRRAISENNIINKIKHFYISSASLFIIFWVLILLINSLISKGDGCGDGQSTEPSEFSFHNASYIDKKVDSQDLLRSSDPTSTYDHPNNQNAANENVGEDLVSDRNKSEQSTTHKDTTSEMISDSSVNLEKEAHPKIDRLSRIAPIGLDEFKSKAISSKEKTIPRQVGSIIHRVEPSGREYNYASASKSAKILAHNKEAKGASNILDKDQDKYLRNPCSAEEKYVVIELSEETLVDTIEIANFEHYSSNLKDLELLSSLVYPTDSWDKLGNFTVANVKHAQRFSLPEPKWARYLKINFLSHYGSEFYCTVSVVEVYGVDAVEKMLEDMISVDNKRLEPEEQIAEQYQFEDHSAEKLEEILEHIDENMKPKQEPPKGASPNPMQETKPSQVGRMPGDTVLKVLMQKVQTLDMNFSVLERYLEELNSRYGHIFKDFDDDINNKDLILAQLRLEIKNLQDSKDLLASEIEDLLIWKRVASLQLDQLVRENVVLRSEIKGIQEYQTDMDNKALAVIFVTFVFGCVATFKLIISILLSICTISKNGSSCRMSSGWIMLLLSCSIITFITLL
ncbi:SUN domain-containing protein 3 [Curcuma longa]|uniref:SUN domain-containing protein 3 n=1 Tax=Curcuma longa TaxID=136217 RepID=UPI003D9DE671